MWCVVTPSPEGLSWRIHPTNSGQHTHTHIPKEIGREQEKAWCWRSPWMRGFPLCRHPPAMSIAAELALPGDGRGVWYPPPPSHYRRAARYRLPEGLGNIKQTCCLRLAFALAVSLCAGWVGARARTYAPDAKRKALGKGMLGT